MNFSHFRMIFVVLYTGYMFGIMVLIIMALFNHISLSGNYFGTSVVVFTIFYFISMLALFLGWLILKLFGIIPEEIETMEEEEGGGGEGYDQEDLRRNVNVVIRIDGMESSIAENTNTAAAAANTSIENCIILKRNCKIEEFSTEDETECSVCLSGSEDDRIWIILGDCKHKFHYKCLRRWLPMKISCPICRDRVGVNQLRCNRMAELGGGGRNRYIYNSGTGHNIAGGGDSV